MKNFTLKNSVLKEMDLVLREDIDLDNLPCFHLLYYCACLDTTRI